MSLQYLINKCGKDTVIKLLPSLFITVDTDKIDTKNIICDNYYYINPQTNIDCENIESIVALFDEIAIDKSMVDSVVISYLGEKHFRFKTGSDNKFGKTLYLDVQAVRIALTDLLTEQTVSQIGNGLKLGLLFFAANYLALHAV
jgi:hypothetical protein